MTNGDSWTYCYREMPPVMQKVIVHDEDGDEWVAQLHEKGMWIDTLYQDVWPHDTVIAWKGYESLPSTS